MNISKKIKAGALQYVLVISVIIAIIIFAFISLIYLQQRLTIKHSFAREVITNTQNTFAYIKQKEIPYNQEITSPFLEYENTTTTFKKKHWGVFDIGIASSTVKNEFFQKVALLGTQHKNREALFLKDNNTSLVLVGKTKITGNVAVPKQGVKTGSISGTSYYGNKLIYGRQKQSAKNLPKIKNLEYLKNLNTEIQNSTNQNFELEEGLELHQSFTKEVLVYQDNAPIVLRDVKLSGHLIVISSSKIIVSPTARLQNILLIAPEIRIQSNTVGNFQAIASKRLTVEKNVNLSYPSGLVVIQKGINNNQIQTQRNLQKKEENGILIQENSSVKGIVLFHSDDIQNNFDTQIQIEENTKIHGEVFCSKNTELLGTVYGAVYTNNFIVKKRGGTYVNHLYDAVINAQQLPKQYAGLQIHQSSNQVAKWVD